MLYDEFENYNFNITATLPRGKLLNSPDSKVRGANMGPIWVLSAPDGPHVGPMNLAIWEQAAKENHWRIKWIIWINCEAALQMKYLSLGWS